jgi:serine/threonine-protein kinase
MPYAPGTVLSGKYELLELAGEGGVATVWRANLRGAAGFVLPVAVKLMKHQFKASEEHISMFVEEARVGSELQHQNIVHLHDFGIDDAGDYFLVMEWVDGLALHDFLIAFRDAGRPTHWPTICVTGIQLLRALGAAHSRRKGNDPAPVIHRDVSPENVLLGANGVVKLTDFGFARAKDRLAVRSTGPGMVKGKLSYLAPEILRFGPATAQSDLYAVGVVLWEALAGKKLFAGTPPEVYKQVIAGEIPELSSLRADLPDELSAILRRALERNPSDRYRSADEMSLKISTLLRGVPRVPDDFIGECVRAIRAGGIARLEV